MAVNSVLILRLNGVGQGLMMLLSLSEEHKKHLGFFVKVDMEGEESGSS